MINMISTAAADPFPRNNISLGEPGEKDLYTDLFAALFTFPVVPAPVQPISPPPDSAVGHDLVLSALPSEISEADALDAFFAEAFKGQKGHSASVNEEVPVVHGEPKETFLLKPLKEGFLEAGTESDNRKLIELLGPPVKPPPDKDGWNIKPNETISNERTPIKPPNDCYLPPIRDEKGDVSGVDLIPVDVFEYPGDLEILEIPDLSPMPSVAAVSDKVLELTNAPLERASTTDQAGLVNGELAADPQVTKDFRQPESQMFSHVAPVSVSVNAAETGFVPSPAFPLAPVKTVDVKAPEQLKPSVSLLETFTNNVFTESKPIKPLRTEFSELMDPYELSGEVKRSGDENQNAENTAEFSFGSSLGGEAVNERIDDPVLADAKAKRLILDQVGSKLGEMAALQRDGGEKSVLKIRLKPAELGTVEVTLAKNSEGVLEAHFQTDSPHTQNILNESLAALRESLENSGIKVGSLETSCTTFSSGGKESKGEQAREFPVGNERPATATSFESDQRSDDEKLNRLVNLRA